MVTSAEIGTRGWVEVEEEWNFGHVHLKSLLDINVTALHVGSILKRQISATLDLDQVSVDRAGTVPG